MKGSASVEDIDTAIQLGLNHPMGPFALMDLIGLDTSLAILEVMHRELGDHKYRPCPLLRQYVAAGWLGRKSGRGFHRYDAAPAGTARRERPAGRKSNGDGGDDGFWDERAVVAREGGVAVVTVNRPDARNALDAETLDALAAAFEALDRDTAVRCAILTGAGDRAFVAGADIKAMAELDADSARRFSERGHRLGVLLEGLRLPVIAAVNGFALGAAASWRSPATSSTRRAPLGWACPRWGWASSRDSAARSGSSRRVGVARARELIYTGRVIDAEEAARIGLVNAVVEPAELLRALSGCRRRDRGPRRRWRWPRPNTPSPARPSGGSTPASVPSATPSRDCSPPPTRKRACVLFSKSAPRPGKAADRRHEDQGNQKEDMNFELAPEQQMIRDTARELATREIAPKAAEIDRSHTFPRKLFERLGEVGLLGVMIPEEHGGSGMDALSLCGGARGDRPRLCLDGGGHVRAVLAGAGAHPERRHRRATRPLAARPLRGPQDRLLRPVRAGSGLRRQSPADPRRARGLELAPVGHEELHHQRARRRRDDRLRQHRARKGHPRHHRLPGADGHAWGDGRTSRRKARDSGAPSAQVFLDDCVVGDDARLGAEGEGFKIAMRSLDGGRIGIAAQALGIARAAFEDAVGYARERKTFGQPIAQHQAIQFKLADMKTEIEAARMLLWRAAIKKDRGESYGTEAAMAKLFASEVANRAAKEGVQVFGGYGYLADYPAERHFRDAKITEIYEGTSEIQRLVIASALLKA